jgi:nucleoside-diphosphate-sugar epimerase
MVSEPAILITGATGTIGGAWLPALAARAPVIALVRGRTRTVPGATLTVACDLADPLLGLDPGTYSALSQSVAEVIHCAADVRFTLPLDEARHSNVQPLANLLAFARSCPHLRKFAHVSTVFVVGDRAGSFDEHPVNPGTFLSTYEQTKWEAECLALSARHLPLAIYRLGIVEGHMVRQLIRLSRKHPFPAIPADPEARIDIVSCRWAVAALNHLHQKCFEPGTIRHVCAGPHRSPTVQQLVAAVQPDPVPALVSLAEFDRLSAHWNGAAADMWNVLRRFLPHLAIRQEFLSHRTWAALEQAGIHIDPLPEILNVRVSTGQPAF